MQAGARAVEEALGQDGEEDGEAVPLGAWEVWPDWCMTIRQAPRSRTNTLVATRCMEPIASQQITIAVSPCK